MLAVAVLANFLASFWNVDPYHEGAIFPSAVGMAQGLHIFSQVNQQYGLISPLIISIALRIFGFHLVVSRILGFFIIASIAALTFAIAKRYASSAQSKFIVLLWLGISPTWSWPSYMNALSGGVWPNHFGVLLILLSVYVLFRKEIPDKGTLFISGSLAFISTQARIEFFFIWFFMTLAFLFFKKAFLGFWLFGSFFSLTLLIFYLIATNSLNDWYMQTIKVWTMNPPDVPRINLTFFALNGINFLSLVFFFFSIFFIITRLVIIKTGELITLIIAILLILIYVYAINSIDRKFMIGGFNVTDLFKYVSMRSVFSIVNVTIILSLWAMWSIFMQFHKNRSSVNIVFFDLYLFVAIAIGSFSLFHNFNADYSQMIFPFFAIFLVVFKKSYNFQLNLKYLNAFSSLCLSFIFVSFLFFILQIHKNFYPYEDSMLLGLKGQSRHQVEYVDSSLQMISNNVSKSHVIFDCQTGLFSTNISGFLGTDKWTWNQQPPEMLRGRLENLKMGDSIIACHLNSEDTFKIENLLESKKISMQVETPNFNIYRVTK